MIINVITLLWYNPTLDQDCPGWVYLSWSIGLFLYQTFDACDGAQARRTRQSGPLGELFDHGMFFFNDRPASIGVLANVLKRQELMRLTQPWKSSSSLVQSTLANPGGHCSHCLHPHARSTLLLGRNTIPGPCILVSCLVLWKAC